MHLRSIFGKADQHDVRVAYEGAEAAILVRLRVGKVFCGESMYSLVPSASKLALIHLCRSGKYDLIDCQFHTPHLESMGGRYISRAELQRHLDAGKK
ncbi:MAG: hypothetical protein JSS76_06230 [Bacteroidetes bacterium]|nr:hypothetical protein [Bacteroidota bacterium]